MELPVNQAASQLKNGEVVAIPTETVFGLAGSIYSDKAIEKIFELKNRPLSNPLIVHISDLIQIKDEIEEIDLETQKLIQAFWPGPLTIILKLRSSAKLSHLITAGLKTIAVRMPAKDETLKLIAQAGPLVAPSANLSGYPSATKREHVERDFGLEFSVLEGEPHCLGIESTIIAKEYGVWKIAREGAVLPTDLEKVLGYIPSSLAKQEKPICPGQHFKHYSPHAKLKLLPYHKLKSIEGVIIGFKERNYPKAKTVINLGSLQSPVGCQKNLYALLRSLDEEGHQEAYIDIDFPEDERLQILKRRIEKAASSC